MRNPTEVSATYSLLILVARPKAEHLDHSPRTPELRNAAALLGRGPTLATSLSSLV